MFSCLFILFIQKYNHILICLFFITSITSLVNYYKKGYSIFKLVFLTFSTSRNFNQMAKMFQITFYNYLHGRVLTCQLKNLQNRFCSLSCQKSFFIQKPKLINIAIEHSSCTAGSSSKRRIINQQMYSRTT